MNFLAVDTSGAQLAVVAYRGGMSSIITPEAGAREHSVVLMDAIDRASKAAALSLSECDFFAVSVGPGSFTGIRIGIATVKGLCLACGKPARAVTSLDCVAYAEESGKRLALVDAGHGCFYAAAYAEGGVEVPPAYCTAEDVGKLIGMGYAPCAAEEIAGAKRVDGANGLLRAVLRATGTCPAGALTALYLRRSSAEERR